MASRVDRTDDAMTFRLTTFGDLRLVDPVSGNLVTFPEKGLLILCMLFADDNQDTSRASVARFLWGEDDEGKSYANLRKTISRIEARQTEIGVSFLDFSATTVRLNRLAITCDFVDLMGPPNIDRMADLRYVLTTINKTFLGRVDVNSSLFTAWLDGRRDLYLGRLRDALGHALPLAETQDDVRLVKEAALRVFEAFPEDDGPREILMRTYEADGQLDGARSLFEGQKKRLWGELELGPDLHTLNAVRRIFERQSAKSTHSITDVQPTAQSLSPLRRKAQPRIALLPPTSNIGENVGFTKTATALIEDITIGLCVLKAVSIVAPYTAAQISQQSDKGSIIQRYSISYLLDTSISDKRGTPCLFAQLIHFPSDEVIWAESFDLQVGHLATQHNEIAHRIAVIITTEVNRNELSRSGFERSPASYHHYLIGQQHLKNLTLPDIRRARKAFRDALQENPYLSPALSGLARTYSREWLMTARGDTELLKTAEHFANKAIAVGEDLAAGYRELGVAHIYLGKFDESVEALDLAETLSPHYADVIADYSDTLVHASRPADGLKKIERAIDLNPLPPDIYLWGAAGASFCIERYEDALSYLGQMKDRSPADRLTAATFAMLGDKKSAGTFVRKSKEVHPDFQVDVWLSIVPFKEQWQKDHYRTALTAAGF